MRLVIRYTLEGVLCNLNGLSIPSIIKTLYKSIPQVFITRLNKFL
jgi:hypothetical protein